MTYLTGGDGDEVRGEGERADPGGAGRHQREPALETVELNFPAGPPGYVTGLEAPELSRRVDYGRQEEEEELEEEREDVVAGYESSGEPESHTAAKLLLLREKSIFHPTESFIYLETFRQHVPSRHGLNKL